MRAGVAISFEGLSNAGKTTAVRALESKLAAEGLRVSVKDDLLNYRSKSDDVGAKIKRILDAGAPSYRLGFPTCETLLILAKRAFETQSVLYPRYSEGDIVLLDRDIDTVCALQAPILQTQRPTFAFEELVVWLRQINELIALEPAMTIFLRVTPADSLAREGSKRGSPLPPNDTDRFLEEAVFVQDCFEKVLDVALPGRTIQYVQTSARPERDVIDEAFSLVRSYIRERARL